MRTLLWVSVVAGLAGVVAGAEKEEPKTKGLEAKAETQTEAKRDGAGPALALDLGGGVTLEVVLIPAGKFLMGTPEEVEQRRDNEVPQHEVRISRAFYMGKYEVTQEQYEKVMGVNPSRFKGPKNPVEKVSWNDAQEFCKKASQLTGKVMRLPTEAEWEYACRAGTKTRFHSGDAAADLDRVAWYNGNSKDTTHPVGQKQPNAWGLYDMHGNVVEWCQEWYAEQYEAGPATDPPGPVNGTRRVLRGGSCSYDLGGCRSALRVCNAPDSRLDDVGFRVVVGVSPRTP